mmetsp:Transcript_24571/g.36062  ORF Transcript_24571/g.36062 Transcript_24571/m.36062 type:complete len:572 (-) Transcript_24571:140-1855(-)|eukprot:CAMPEP_0195514382 /NCGR_PEP_ID=MMETSP0794_2-20130614/5785_1 /TAXON_ID=515487 /ORGANISM="Stephanopyxis turris, Strain CCMP 815" /LENGTH=571 /DNA_ID=CAMNT_0040642619 /DNA_START=39 /DNA_END=1754 /DNA_ORIENTATION=+
MDSNETDPLLITPHSANNTLTHVPNDTNDNKHKIGLHLKTYTAGEDASRLAAAAKELGLARHRNPRAQVRSTGTSIAETFHQVLPLLTNLEDNHKDSPDGGKVTNLGHIIAGVFGNVLEWYDFAVFGYFGDIIGQVFFPAQEGNIATMESFAVFGGAFLMRPVGGLLLGYLGDVYGRKKALTTSIFLMAFPTFAMGLLPSFQQAGYVSTVLLIVIRLLQGMSVGGQLMSSLVFTLENVPRKSWGLYGSFVLATGNFGVLMGSLVGSAVRDNLSEEDMISFGWRIPFLSGIVVSFAGFYLRWTDDGSEEEEHGSKQKQHNSSSSDYSGSVTPSSQDCESAINGDTPNNNKVVAAQEKKNPILLLLAPSNLRPLLASAMVPMMWSAGFYLSFVWMAIYMTDLCEHPVPHAFAVNSAALLLSVCLLFPIAGVLSDKYGRRTIMSIGGMSLILFSPFLISAIGQGNPWLSFVSQLFLGVCLSFWGSPMCAWLVESFEPEARLTSVSVGYNMAQAVVGGSTPALATYLVDAVGTTSPGWIYVVIGCVSMVGLWVVAPPAPSSQSNVVYTKVDTENY